MQEGNGVGGGKQGERKEGRESEEGRREREGEGEGRERRGRMLTK